MRVPGAELPQGRTMRGWVSRDPPMAVRSLEELCPLLAAPPQCAQGKEFKCSVASCEPTCTDPDVPANCSPGNETCQRGCYCKDGLVEAADGTCGEVAAVCGCPVPNSSQKLQVSATTSFCLSHLGVTRRNHFCSRCRPIWTQQLVVHCRWGRISF